MSSLQDKVEKWKSLPKERKMEIIKEVFDYFISEARENKLVALTEFTAWLASDDGAIIFPWMWKEKYRDVMIDVAANYLRIINELINKGLNLLNT